MQKKRVIFCVLNWGLGHATRSLPIIRELNHQGWEVIVCSDGLALEYLRKELPGFITEPLPSYNMDYKGRSIALIMLRQFPKMVRARFAENQKLTEYVRKYKPDLVISDNRFGCFSSEVKSIFICHQWNLLGTKLKKHKIASRINQDLIKRNFDQVWIADDKEIRLSGILSKKNPHKIYTGIVSRFQVNETSKAKDLDFLFIISGPEPLRTELEVKALTCMRNLPDRTAIIIRGTLEALPAAIPKNVQHINLAKTQEIQEAVQRAKLIISRSGYSSLMDYLTLHYARLLLIPTPMQTEQIYLARHFSKGNTSAIHCTQSEFSEQILERALQIPSAEKHPYINTQLSLLIASLNK